MKNTNENNATIDNVTNVSCVEKDTAAIEKMMISAIKVSAGQVLEGQDKENWKLVEKLFRKAAKLKEAHIFGRLYNNMTAFLMQFFDTKTERFVPAILSNEQVKEVKRLLKEYASAITSARASISGDGVMHLGRDCSNEK